MTPAEAFFAREFPVPGGTAISCIGVRLDGEIATWAEAALPFVTEQERRHAGRFVHLIDGARHLVGRALVRRVLSAALRAAVGDFTSTPQGKPICTSAGLDFSISHSGLMVWAAFSSCGKVGVDVEQRRETDDLLRLAAMLHPEEYAELEKLPPAELPSAFYRCWVRKEAVLKASGAGLSKPLGSFCVHTDKRKTGWLKSIDGGAAEAWFTQDIPSQSGYHCSVASDAPGSGTNVLFVES